MTLSDSCRLLRRQGARGSSRPLNLHQQQHRSTSPLFTIRILDDKRPGYNRHGRAYTLDQDRLVRRVLFFLEYITHVCWAYWRNGSQDGSQKLRLRQGHRQVKEGRESITCKAQTPDILSFSVAFTSNIKSRPVINILWHLFLAPWNPHCFTFRDKLFRCQCCSRLACTTRQILIDTPLRKS